MYAIAHKPIPRRVGIRAFQRLADRWSIKKKDWHILLGRNSPNTVQNWIKSTDHDAFLETDVQERLSHLIAIYDGLHRLFGDAKYADEWIHTPNKAFGGQKPLDRMLSGQFSDIYEVRLYIERALAM